MRLVFTALAVYVATVADASGSSVCRPNQTFMAAMTYGRPLFEYARSLDTAIRQAFEGPQKGRGQRIAAALDKFAAMSTSEIGVKVTRADVLQYRYGQVKEAEREALSWSMDLYMLAGSGETLRQSRLSGLRIIQSEIEILRTMIPAQCR